MTKKEAEIFDKFYEALSGSLETINPKHHRVILRKCFKLTHSRLHLEAFREEALAVWPENHRKYLLIKSLLDKIDNTIGAVHSLDKVALEVLFCKRPLDAQDEWRGFFELIDTAIDRLNKARGEISPMVDLIRTLPRLRKKSNKEKPVYEWNPKDPRFSRALGRTYAIDHETWVVMNTVLSAYSSNASLRIRIIAEIEDYWFGESKSRMERIRQLLRRKSKPPANGTKQKPR